MTFPTIPTVGAGRVLVANIDGTGTRTFPSLSSLTKNAGDVLIAIIVAYQSSSGAGAPGGTVFSSWGASFNEFCDQMTTNSSTMAIGAAWKVSDGTETGTFTVTQAAAITGGASLILMSIPGARRTTAPEVTTIANGTAAAANPGALNPTNWDAEDTLWIAVTCNGMTNISGAWGATGASAPTNYTNRVDTNRADDSVVGRVEGAVSFRQNNTSSEDVGAESGHDLSNARNSALLIAVRPGLDLTSTADLTFVGDKSKHMTRALAAAVDFVGDKAKHISRALSAAASWVGDLVGTFIPGASGTEYFQSVEGAVTFVGDIVRRVGSGQSAALTFVGTALRHVGHTLSGAASFVGTALKRTSRLLAGAANFVGSALKRASRPVAGALSFAGSVAKRTSRALSAGTVFAGTVTKRTGRAVAGAATFVGSAAKRTSRALAAAISWVGAGGMASTLIPGGGGGIQYQQAVGGALTFAGAQAKRAHSTASSALTFVGTTTKRTSRALAAALSPVGALVRTRLLVFAAALSMAGAMARTRVVALVAALALAGTVARNIHISMIGGMILSAAIALVAPTPPFAPGETSRMWRARSRAAQWMAGIRDRMWTASQPPNNVI